MEPLTFARNDNGEVEAWQGDRTSGPLTFAECVDALHWWERGEPIRFAMRTRAEWARMLVDSLTRQQHR